MKPPPLLSCTRSIHFYFFEHCFENLSEEVSYGLGLASVICWILAEVPQIVTNFRTNSAHGLSLLLLLTWIIGDLFNLVGCVLEPSTLTTQLYTAVLYIIGSSTLVLQCVYYEHFLPWYKQNCIKKSKDVEDDVVWEPLLHPASSGSDLGRSLSVQVSPARPIYHGSGSTLTGSPSSSAVKQFNFFRDQNHGTPTHNDCLLNESVSVLKKAASYGTFVAAAANLTRQTNASFPVRMNLTLQENYMSNDGQSNAAYGQLSGWLMASIYILGRIPQIWLNIEKGSVEGLNPLLFSFTLVGNVTYLASILVRSTKWEKIKPELPWLLDASMCGTLDILILLQYSYYRYNISRVRKKNACIRIEEARD